MAGASDDHLRRDFFEAFRDYAHHAGFHGDWHGSRVLRRREGPIAFGARVRANSGEAELLIDSGDRRTNERIFEAVSRYAHTTSPRLAETLRWDDKDERQRFKVSASERPLGYADRSSWQQMWDAYLGDVLDLERFLRPGLPSDVPSTGWAPRHGSRLATQTRTLGAQYRPADERRSSTRLPFTVDPDAIDRGNWAHSTTQNLLAVALTRAGLTPRSPRLGEPDFDLAWERDGTWFVAEVKSLAAANESKQLRLGLGQVLDYRYALAQRHHRVEAVLMVERAPTLMRWRDLCRGSGVTLLWPSIIDPFLSRVARSGGKESAVGR